MHFYLWAVWILSLIGLALSHGETFPGPHKGHIRMPGAFHTELLIEEDNQLKIYLLDGNFENPAVKKSRVSGTYRTPGKEFKFFCLPNTDHFRCQLPKDINLTRGELVLDTKRMGTPGGWAVYQLPLKYAMVSR